MNYSVRDARPWALIEIGCDTDEADRIALIRAAYRSSRSGLVALALRGGVTPQTIDRILDGVVDARDNGIKGVVYINGDDEPALLAAAACASIVVASTKRFRSELAERGIAALDSRESAHVLDA